MASWKILWSYNASLPCWTRRENSQIDAMHCANNASWNITRRISFNEISGVQWRAASCISVSSSLTTRPMRIPMDWFRNVRSLRQMIIWTRSAIRGQTSSTTPAMGKEEDVWRCWSLSRTFCSRSKYSLLFCIDKRHESECSCGRNRLLWKLCYCDVTPTQITKRHSWSSSTWWRLGMQGAKDTLQIFSDWRSRTSADARSPSCNREFRTQLIAADPPSGRLEWGSKGLPFR